MLRNTARFGRGIGRTLLSGAAPVFLPQVGPFAASPRTKASSVPNRTILNTTATLAASRRATPLEYNTFTIDNSVVNATDFIVFLRCNIFRLQNSALLNIAGGAGSSGDTGLHEPGAGGDGVSGGGGGAAFSACSPGTFYPGGTGGIGYNGGQGGSGDFPGNFGGSGSGQAAFGPPGDGGPDNYDYAADMVGGPFISGDLPYLAAGDGSVGGKDCCGHEVVGGGGGGTGGMIVIACNRFIGLNTNTIYAYGGDGGPDGDGNGTPGGSGGNVLIYAGAYPVAFMNGRVFTFGGTNSPAEGTQNLYKTNADNSYTLKSFATTF